MLNKKQYSELCKQATITDTISVSLKSLAGKLNKKQCKQYIIKSLCF